MALKETIEKSLIKDMNKKQGLMVIDNVFYKVSKCFLSCIVTDKIVPERVYAFNRLY